MKNTLFYSSLIITLLFTSCHVNLDFKIGKNDEKNLRVMKILRQIL